MRSLPLSSTINFNIVYMQIMDFYKYHALGNDYIVIDPQRTNIPLTENAIRCICDRNFGVGSDGILYGPLFEKSRIEVRIYNPDGSEAEKGGCTPPGAAVCSFLFRPACS